jgi:hypothetical protein
MRKTIHKGLVADLLAEYAIALIFPVENGPDNSLHGVACLPA